MDKFLSILKNNCNLNNPEEVLSYIANKNVTNSTKNAYCYGYKKYCKYYKIQAEIPYYKAKAKAVRIPTKQKLEILTSSAGKSLSTKLRISMETGLRPIEVCTLKVKDIDLEQKLIYPTTAKYGSARTLKMSNKLQNILQNHISKHNLNADDKLFKGNSRNYGKCYREMRNHLAEKLQDQTIKTIRLYDYRHFFASNLYNKTKDILYVKQQMGHKNIETTLIYTQLININEEEEYTCKTATTIKEATDLLENGFQYITEIDGTKLFRKRK